MRTRWLVFLVSTGLFHPACSSHDAVNQSSDTPDASVDATRPAATLVPASVRARDTLLELRSRFVRQPKPADLPTDALSRASADRPAPVIPAGFATGFERVAGGLRPVVAPVRSKASLMRAASVLLPERADGQVRITDDKSGMQLGFVLERSSNRPAEVAEGLAVFDGAGPFGSRIIHRPHVEGTEDYVVFEEKPAAEELLYQVDVSRVAGLRLVANTLEFLDDKGTPALRVAPPYVADKNGETIAARLAVEGCAYDTDPRSPWDRPVVAPGASRCTVKITWDGVQYPAVVDPAWSTTGSMATGRRQHTADLLNNGRVLVAGGYTGSTGLQSTEVFDPNTLSWSATANLINQRYSHQSILLNDGRVLVCGGSASANTCERYSTSTGAWSAAGTMNAAHGSAFTLTRMGSGMLLVAGGWSSSTALGAVEKSTDAFGSGWSNVTSLTTPRYQHTAVRLSSGHIIFAGGATAAFTATASVESYNEATATISTQASMNTARYDHVAWTDGYGMWVASGSPTASTVAEKFSGQGGTWTNLSAMNTLRASTVFAPGFDWVIGGYNGNPSPTYLTSIERFAGNGWLTQQPLIEGRGQHTVTKLQDGRLLAAGGRNVVTFALASAEIHAAQAALGVTCIDAGDCLSGFCVDGVCCDSACTADCYACTAALKGSGSNGTCGMQAGGMPCGQQTCANGIQTSYVCSSTATCTTTTLSCDPYVCEGNGCIADCAINSDCAAGYYCSAPDCKPKLANGSSCSSANVCQSGYCVDSYCCDSACTGNCVACSTARKFQGSNGTCGYVKAGYDPDSNCTASQPATCGYDGNCNGAGACAYWSSTTSCGTATCSGSTLVDPKCTGNGTCTNVSTDCKPFACANGKCNTTCQSASDCATGYYCDGNTCLLSKTLGDSCQSSGQCASGFCIDGVCCQNSCGNGDTSDCQSCNLSGQAGFCKPLVSGTQCRNSAGVCDQAEYCDGSSLQCPADTFLSQATICRQKNGECDVAENCTGNSATCPANVVRAAGSPCSDDGKMCTVDTCDGVVASPTCVHTPGNAGIVCNPAANECDVEEKCTGSLADCPSNAVKPAGTACGDDGNPCSTDLCNGSGTNPACLHNAGNAGATCRPAAGVCDAAETCTGGSLTCPSDSKLGSTTTCRPAADLCDVAEVCDGANNNCPADGFKASTSSCRVASCSNDVATLAANCPGNGAACPDAVTQSCSPSICNGAICGGCSSDTQCPVGQYCSGGVCSNKKANGQLCSTTGECVSGFCADGVCCNNACNAGPCDTCTLSGAVGTCSPMPATTECRAAAGECDIAETCGGAMACPADARKPANTECTPDTNPCSRDICDGSDTSCKHPAGNTGVLCRNANGSPCDVADYCDGSSLTCTDAKRPSSYVCRSADGKECDVAETCTGTGDACPADLKKPLNTSCTDDGNVCTKDLCDGTSGDCQHPAGNAGAVCRAANGACDVEDTCSGSSSICSDNKRPSSFVCRVAADECDQADNCDGASDLCPADLKKPNGTSCADDGNPCSLDICNGSLNTCTHPAGFAGVLCRAADGPCDLPDTCSGQTTVCGDVKKTAGTVCRQSAGTCDVEETCSGTSNACPTDSFLASTTQCRAASCNNALATLSANCTGSSAACPDAQTQDCAPSTCSGTQCGGCQSDTECPSSKYCSAGVCTNKKVDGQACSGGNQCQNNFCVDGVCCNTACNGGICDSCALTGSVGTCSPVAADTVCRTAVSECDVEEKCGGSLTCPADETNNGKPCSSDQNMCTTDVCQGTTCTHGAAPADTVCRLAAGECDVAETCGGATACPTDAFKPEDTACSTDDNVCTKDVCKSGSCTHAPGNAGTTCRQAVNECDAAEACDGASAACPADLPMPDETPCTPEGNVCTRDICMAGACSHPAGNQGTICRASMGDCDVEEVCDGTTPACPTDTLKADGTACPGDELPCTQDICASGLCVHPIGLAGTVCRAAASECDISESCDGQAATCPADIFKSDTTACTDDGFFCTRDECQAGACQHPSKDGTSCDDTNSCTQNDSCSAGQCVGTQIPGCLCGNDADCNDDNACNGEEKCVAGACVNGAALDCDDKNTCTTDGCDPLGGCSHVALADGSTCNDGKYCRIGDECSGGVCAGTADRDCSGSATGLCQVGVCDEPTMSCLSKPMDEGTACDDSDSCTLLDKCASGACVGQPKVGCKVCVTATDCDDLNECTTDLCDDASKQCSWAAIPNCTPDAGPEAGPEGGLDASKDASDAQPDQGSVDAADAKADSPAAQDAKSDQDAAQMPDEGVGGASGDAEAEPTFTRETPSCACRAAPSTDNKAPMGAAAAALLIALALRRRGVKRTGSAEEGSEP